MNYNAKSRQKALLFLAATIVLVCVFFVASRRHVRHPMPPPEPQATASAAIRIQSVAPKPPTILKSDRTIVTASIVTVCGADPATDDRYEAWNEALRAIARGRNLSSNDVASLVSWLVSTNDVLRVERLAALKNDVMNLLRNQEPPPPGFADTLIAMFEGGDHPPAILDYCIQHL